MPSPLDRPGLDDPPLREWVADAEDGDSLGLGEAHARALRELVTPVEYAPGMRKSDNEINEERPERDNETNPISIELVRGANGPGADVDGWTVLIDGVRCAPVSRPDASLKKFEDVYHLPLPFKDRRSLGGGYDAVRPVVFGVRLEGEALEPAEVELVVEEVIESADTLKARTAPPTGWESFSGRIAEEHVVELSTEKLPHYTPLDPTARCVATSYPFRAPSQSAFGIFHVDTANRAAQLFARLTARAMEIGSDVALASKRWNANEKLRSMVHRHTMFVEVARATSFVVGRNARLDRLDGDLKKLDRKKSTQFAKIDKVPVFTEANRRRTQAIATEQTTLNRAFDNLRADADYNDPNALDRIESLRETAVDGVTPKPMITYFRKIHRERQEKKTEVENAIDDEKAKLEKRIKKEKDRFYMPSMYVPRAPTVRNAVGGKRQLAVTDRVDDHRECTIIGGDDRSAIEGLVVEFKHLIHALQICKVKLETQRAEGESELEYRSKFVNEMRKLLIDQGEDKATRLLEALFAVKPTFLSYVSQTPPAWGAELGPTREDVTPAVYEQAYDSTKQGFFLLLERLFASELQKSSVRSRFRIRVREHGELQKRDVCLFEATRHNGFLAHAAYTDANGSFRDLQALMKQFYRELTETPKDDEMVQLRSLWSLGIRSAESFPKVFRWIGRLILESDAIDRQVDRAGNRRWLQTLSSVVELLKKNAGDFSLAEVSNGLGLLSAALGTYGTYTNTTDRVELAKSRSAIFNTGDPVRYAFLRLMEPGTPELLSTFLSGSIAYLGAGRNAKPYFTAMEIKSGFATLKATLYEIEKVVGMSLPLSDYESLAGARGASLAKEAASKTSSEDTEAQRADEYIRTLRVAEQKRLEAVRMRRQLYCRMPQVVAPKEVPPDTFTMMEKEWMVASIYADQEKEKGFFDKELSNTVISAITLLGLGPVQDLVLKVTKGLGWFPGSSIFSKWGLDRETAGWLVPGLGIMAGSLVMWGPAFLMTAATYVGYTGSFSFAAAAMAFAAKTYKDSSDIYAQAQEGEVRLMDDTVRHTNAIANTVIAIQKKRLEVQEDNYKKYKECTRRMRGNPIQKAVQNANATARKVRTRMGDAKVKGALALHADGTRFRFYERFYVRHVDVDLLRDRLHQATPALAWTRLPDGLALRFVPPLELTERVRDGEDLRRAAMNAAIARVAETGFAPRGQSGADLARLSAQRIHTELQLALRDAWLFPASDRERVPGGRHYMTRSAPQTATLLTERACALLLAAFGTETPTLVGASDVFFDCLPGGAAARLALRHMPVVTETLNAIMATAIANKTLYRVRLSLFEPATQYWTRERRAILKQLCRAWTEAAKGASRMLVPQLDLPRASREALASFGRVKALASPDDTVARLAAAAAAAALHAVVRKTAVAARREEALRALAIADGELADFGYQAALSMPADAPRTPSAEKADKAAFAARRLDLDAMRKAPVGDGVDALVDALGPADLLGVDHDTEHYYVAGGDNLDFQPSPLLYSGVVAQPLWLARVVAACDRLAATLSDQPPRGDADLDDGVAVVRRRPETDPGLARHPLVVTRRGQGAGEVIGVQVLSQSLSTLRFRRTGGEGDGNGDGDGEVNGDGDGDGDGEGGTAGAATLLQALSLLCDDATPEEEATATLASTFARRRVDRARVLAFNVDRCAAGLALAASAPQTEVEAEVEMGAGRASPTVTEVALALALARSASDQVCLRVADAGRARLHLERLRARCAAAGQDGCKAATLAEVAVAVVDLEATSGV